MISRAKKIVEDELSGRSAKLHIQQITNFHRIQASTMFREAAEYVKNRLLEIGLEDAKIEQFVSDGRKKYWTHGISSLSIKTIRHESPFSSKEDQIL